jgi:putative copper resistance protein D
MLAGLLALAANLLMPPGRGRCWVFAALGGIACASFSWMGHGAATEGPAGWVHLGGDILHSLAAAAWIGALAVFAFWLMRKEAEPRLLLAALQGFSLFGMAFVTVIAATGLLNAYFLVGLSRLPMLWSSLYGELLLLKVGLFLVMLWLAARNRSVHTPALATASASSSGALRQSVLLETGLGIVILAIVAWLGMLPPPSSLGS